MVLVGRERELQVLERRLAAARAGSSSALVICGEAGIGKTALIAEAEALAGGMRVLRAVGTASEQDLPFAGLDQLLRPVLPLLDRVPAPQAVALARALALHAGPTPQRFAVSAATLSLVCRAAEDTPLLVTVDDLHQLDRPSAEAILFVARRLLTDRVVMLLGVRTDEGADDLVAGLDRIDLNGLTPQGTEALVADRSLSVTQLTRLQALTAGNPLALLEMAQYPDLLADAGAVVPLPGLITRAFTARLARLHPATRAALLLAAVGDVDLATLARARSDDGGDLHDLAEAERVGLVTLADDRVRFRHPLLRAAVQQAAEPAERRAAHRALAEALDDLDRRAWHLSEAALEPDEAVALELEDAAGSAQRRGAFAVAAGRYERSARLSEQAPARARRLTAAGESAWLGGLSERAATLLEEAARTAPDPAVRTRATALRGVLSARSGALDQARDLLLDAADALRSVDADAATLLLAEAVYACFYLGDTGATADVVRRLDDLDRHDRSARARLLGDLASGMGLIVLGEGVEGTTRVRRAVESAAGSELEDDPRWLPWLLLGPIWLRESGAARRGIDDVLTDARDRAAVGTLPFLLFHAARDDATTDRWVAAEAGFREAVALARETGLRTDEAISLSGLTWLLARQGRESEARIVAEDAEVACLHSRLHLGRAWVRYALGDLEAGLGNTEAAVASYRAQGALVAELGITDPDLSPAAELVECLVRLGEADAAVTEARAYAAAASAKGQPWAQGRAHRALALSGVDPGVHFAAALAEHAHTPDVYEAARTELAYGAWLRRERRRVDARPHLRTALAAFDRLGAAPWAESAASELRATGERVHARSGDAAQPLTPQEFQIARLLADGRTTREAAAALFLSPKTVEYHLRHVYIKLGISSRRELAERVAADPELRS